MPVKIVGSRFIGSKNSITLAQLRKMWAHFKTNPGGGNGLGTKPKETTFYAHFPIKNIMDLLVVNGIVKPTDTIQQASEIVNFAIRVFFSQHAEPGDCPDDKAGDYVGRNTVVLVNARYKGSDQWEDMISDDPQTGNAIEMTGFQMESTVDPMRGSDKTYLCPPQCSGTVEPTPMREVVQEQVQG